MPTLILSPRYTPDSNALWRAALNSGWDVERLHAFACPPDLAGREPVYYGETLLADAISAPLGLVLLQPSDDWLPSLPLRYRLRDVVLATIGQARTLLCPRFVKPVDEKWFPARVYDSGASIASDQEVADDLPVLIAEPVCFEAEYRAFVCERQIATLSPYLRAGVIAQEPDGEWPADSSEMSEARSFLAQMLGDGAVDVPPATVIDVGRIAGRGWAVVEANACWASGLCGCDPLAVLPVLRRAAVPGAALAQEHRRWARIA